MFELRPNVNKPIFGHPFTTNAFAMRDRPSTAREASGDVPDRRPGLVDRHGLGRQY